MKMPVNDVVTLLKSMLRESLMELSNYNVIMDFAFLKNLVPFHQENKAILNCPFEIRVALQNKFFCTFEDFYKIINSLLPYTGVIDEKSRHTFNLCENIPTVSWEEMMSYDKVKLYKNGYFSELVKLVANDSFIDDPILKNEINEINKKYNLGYITKKDRDNNIRSETGMHFSSAIDKYVEVEFNYHYGLLHEMVRILANYTKVRKRKSDNMLYVGYTFNNKEIITYNI